MSTTRLVFHGTALTDLLLVGSARRANVLAGVPFLPGSAIRGHLAQRWLRTGSDDDTFRDLFESGRLRFHTTHPTVTSEATLPAPLSMRTCKVAPLATGHDTADTLTSTTAPVCTAHGPLPTATKRVRGVVAPDGTLLDPEQRMVTRSRIGTVDDDTGSGLARHGALFTERRLAAGTRFVFEIDGDQPGLDCIAGLLGRAGDVVTVGRARSVLGAVEVGEPQLLDLPAVPPPTGEVALTFLSDTILLDPWHRSIVALDEPAQLATLLSVELGTPVTPTDITVLGAAARSTTVGGWDARERGHKPIEPAIAAGSVVRFGTDRTDLLELLAAQPALGWRRAEGYGRFGLDHWLHTVTLHRAAQPGVPSTVDAGRDRLASTAAEVANQLATNVGASRSLWQGIEATVRAGVIPTPQAEPDPAEQHAQSRSGRSADAGRTQRTARRATIDGFLAACTRLGIDPVGPDGIVLADDIGRELDLLAARGRGR